MGGAALHGDAERGDVGDLDGVVLGVVDRLGQVEADLLGVHVEGGHELHVGDVVVAELDVHQPGHRPGRVGAAVVLHALDQGARAVADSHDCYSYRTHGASLRMFSVCLGVLLRVTGAGCRGRGGGRCGGRVGQAGLLVVTALGVDQLREPPDLSLDGLHAVPLELHRVAVHLLLGLLQLVLDPVEPLLEPAAPALQDPQPGADVGAAEEREPDVEVVVLPRGRSDVGHQPLELLDAGRGELVDDPLAAARRARLGRRDVLGDPAGLEHLLQRRVERPVGQQPAPAEHAVDLLAELVAVHGRLVQQSEDGELEGLSTAGHGAAPSRIGCEGRVYRRLLSP